MERPYTFSSNFFRLLESNNELFDEETFQQVLQERIEFTRELTSIQASYPDTGSIASAASHEFGDNNPRGNSYFTTFSSPVHSEFTEHFSFSPNSQSSSGNQVRQGNENLSQPQRLAQEISNNMPNSSNFEPFDEGAVNANMQNNTLHSNFSFTLPMNAAGTLSTRQRYQPFLEPTNTTPINQIRAQTSQTTQVDRPPVQNTNNSSNETNSSWSLNGFTMNNNQRRPSSQDMLVSTDQLNTMSSGHFHPYRAIGRSTGRLLDMSPRTHNSYEPYTSRNVNPSQNSLHQPKRNQSLRTNNSEEITPVTVTQAVASPSLPLEFVRQTLYCPTARTLTSTDSQRTEPAVNQPRVGNRITETTDTNASNTIQLEILAEEDEMLQESTRNDSCQESEISAAMQVAAARQLLIQAATSGDALRSVAFSQALTKTTLCLDRVISEHCPRFSRAQMKASLSLTSTKHTQSPAPRIPTCSICLDKIVSTIVLPCRHFFCETCAPKITKCGLCRKNIKNKHRVYF